MHDVIVAGAGPAGTLAARSLAEKEYEVLVLEDHKAPGQPQHCTGLISQDTLDMSGVSPDILSTLHGAEFVFPNGQSILLQSEKVKCMMVDRVDLDIKMAEAATDAGADFCYSESYVSHKVGTAVDVGTTLGTHRAKALIGADGAGSKVAMALGDNYPAEYVRGIQVDVKYTMDNQDVFRVHLGNSVAPGFFAWEIPAGPFTRIGLCTSWDAGAPSGYLSDLLIKMGLEDDVVKVYSGKIPLGGRPILSGDRCLLAGDAAGFVKPLSGGGLYPAFRANRHLIDVLTNGLDSFALSSRDLMEYDKRIKEDIGKELKRAYSYRKRFKRLSDQDFNRVYDYIVKNDLVSELNDLDIDHPGEAVKTILHNPIAALSAIPIVLRSLR